MTGRGLECRALLRRRTSASGQPGRRLRCDVSTTFCKQIFLSSLSFEQLGRKHYLSLHDFFHCLMPPSLHANKQVVKRISTLL